MKENDTDANDPGKSPDPKAWWVQSKEEMGRHSTALWTTFAPIYPLDSHQSVRLQLVLELIRAGRIDDCLSLSHEAEQFVLNGMENKPVDAPADFDSSWPQTKEEVVSDPSIKEKFNEKWKVKAPPKCMMPGSTIEPLPLAEMCETIIKYNGKDEVVAGEWTLRNENQSYDLLQHGCCVNYPESKVRNILMGFPPFNRNLPVAPSQEEVHGGGESPLDPENMTLWEICEAIIETALPLEAIVVGNWKLSRSAFSVFELFTIDDYRHMLGLDYFSIQRGSEDGREMIMEQLMQFPPFKK